jgi:hypothetical protein
LINAYRPTYQFHACVIRVAKDEMVAVEIGQGGSTNPTSHLDLYQPAKLLFRDCSLDSPLERY